MSRADGDEVVDVVRAAFGDLDEMVGRERAPAALDGLAVKRAGEAVARERELAVPLVLRSVHVTSPQRIMHVIGIGYAVST